MQTTWIILQKYTRKLCALKLFLEHFGEMRRMRIVEKTINYATTKCRKFTLTWKWNQISEKNATNTDNVLTLKKIKGPSLNDLIIFIKCWTALSKNTQKSVFWFFLQSLKNKKQETLKILSEWTTGCSISQITVSNFRLQHID